MSNNTINNKNITIAIIILILFYCACSYYISKKNVSEKNKKMVYFITIYGYILGILLTCYEVCVISNIYYTNMFIRIPEFIISTVIIGIILYSHTFENDINSDLGKLAISMWPLLTSFILISTLCLNSIYEYYR